MFDPYFKTKEITIKKKQQNAPFLSKYLNSFIHRNIYETEYRSLRVDGPVMLFRDNGNCLDFYSHMF